MDGRTRVQEKRKSTSVTTVESKVHTASRNPTERNGPFIYTLPMPPSRVSEPRACETINTISFARTLVAAGCNAPHSSQRAAVKPQNEKASRGKQAAVRGEEAVAQRIARPLSGRSEARLPPTVAYGRTSDGCGKELRALRKNCNGTCGVYAQAKQATGGARQAHCKRVEAWTCRSSGEFYYVGARRSQRFARDVAANGLRYRPRKGPPG